MKTINISLPQIEGVELKNATVDLEKGIVVAEYGQEYGEEDAEKDISEIAVDFRSAVDYLMEDLHQMQLDTTAWNIPKLSALNWLILIAEAWNSFDEFKLDWDDTDQYKYYPLFKFINGKFEFSNVSYGRFVLDPHISSFSFKTRERAEQFGKQFIDLFRMILTN